MKKVAAKTKMVAAPAVKLPVAKAVKAKAKGKAKGKM